MPQFETDMGRALQALADDTDPRGAGRVRAKVDRAFAQRRRRRRITVAAAGAAVAGLAAAMLTTSGVLSADRPTQVADPPPTQASRPPDNIAGVTIPIKPGHPCLYARKHPLSELTAKAKTPVWMPNSRHASLENLTGAWTCGGSWAYPVLTFGPIEVSFEPGWQNVDNEEKWPDYVKFWGGWVDTVLGRTAAVEPAMHDPVTGRTRGQVMVIVDDILIRVMGDGTVPAHQLVEVADSIDLTQPFTDT